MTLLLPLLAFLFASLLVDRGGAARCLPDAAGTIDRRLGEVTGMPMHRGGVDAATDRPWSTRSRRLGSMAPQIGRRRWASCSSGSIVAGFRGSEAMSSSSASASAWRWRRSRSWRRRSSWQPNLWLGSSVLRLRLRAAGHGAGAPGEAPAASHPARAARRARSARGQRRGGARPRPGAFSASATSWPSRIRISATSCG